MSTYFALLTNIGTAKLANATALGTQLSITKMAVGDGGGVLPIPNPAQTALINEKRRALLNMLSVDPANDSQIIAEQVIPESEGGFWIREIGLYDDNDDLIAIANCPETYKPKLQEGSGRVQTVRMILVVSSTDAVTLKIDPSVVLATRAYVDNAISGVEEAKVAATEAARNAIAAAENAQTAAGVTYTYGTYAELSARTGADGQAGRVFNDDGTHADPVSGGVVNNNGMYIWSSAASAWEWQSADLLSKKADKDDVISLEIDGDKVNRSFETELADVAERKADGNSWPQSHDHYLWAFGVQAGIDQDIESEAVMSCVAINVELAASSETVRLKIYRRPTDSGTYSTPPGAGANDTLLFTQTKSLSELGLTAASGYFQSLKFPFNEIVAKNDYTYLFEFHFYDATGADVGTGISRSTTEGLTNQQRGFYDDGKVVNSVSGNDAIAWSLSVDKFIVQGLRDITAGISTVENRLARSFDVTFKASGTRQSDGTYWPASDNHYAWAFGAQCGAGQDIVSGNLVDTISIDTELDSTITGIRLQVWRRPTDAGTYSKYPGASESDVLIFSQTKTPSELGLTAASGYFQSLRFPFDSLTTENGYTYLFEFRFYGVSGNKGAGITRTTQTGTLNQQQRGWFDGASSLASNRALAWELGGFAYTAESISENAPGLDTRDRIVSATAKSTGLTIDVGGTYARDSDKSAFTGSVEIAMPTTGNVVNEPRTLTSRQGTLPPINYYNAAGMLAHSNVSNVIVKDEATGVILTRDIDYALEPVNGGVALQNSGNDRAVTVSYHWSQQRYDLICINAESRALTVVQGEERRRDAGEFLPLTQSSLLIPLFYARVADGFEVELIPVWYLDGQAHRELLQSRRADYEAQRQALEPIMKIARRGGIVKVAAMGDSIGSQSGGGTPSNSAPNGPYRDRVDYFTRNIGDDVISQIPLYDIGDGAGQVHTRTTHIWDFVRALEDMGATVEYYNFCIGGTGSGTGTNNAGDPVLRRAVWDVAPDVLVTNYGMNEIGSANTESNLNDLFAEAGANGVKCVFALGMPRPGSLKTTATIAAVRSTWRQTRRAAEFFRVNGVRRGAYFAAERVVDDDYRGAMGISLKEYGGADKFHHPGLHEYRTYGAEIRALILGE